MFGFQMMRGLVLILLGILLNGGTTWTAATVGGTVSATAPTGWGEAYFQNKRQLTADAVTAGTFYIYNDGQRSGQTKAYIDQQTKV